MLRCSVRCTFQYCGSTARSGCGPVRGSARGPTAGWAGRERMAADRSVRRPRCHAFGRDTMCSAAVPCARTVGCPSEPAVRRVRRRRSRRKTDSGRRVSTFFPIFVGGSALRSGGIRASRRTRDLFRNRTIGVMKMDIARQPLLVACLTLAAVAVAAIWCGSGGSAPSPVRPDALPGDWVSAFQLRCPGWSRWIALFCILFTGIYLGRFSNRFNLYAGRCYLPIPFFGMAACCFGAGGGSLLHFVVAAIAAIAVRNCCAAFRNGYGFNELFRASLCLGLLPLLSPATWPVWLLLPMAVFLFERTLRFRPGPAAFRALLPLVGPGRRVRGSGRDALRPLRRRGGVAGFHPARNCRLVHPAAARGRSAAVDGGRRGHPFPDVLQPAAQGAPGARLLRLLFRVGPFDTLFLGWSVAGRCAVRGSGRGAAARAVRPLAASSRIRHLRFAARRQLHKHTAAIAKTDPSVRKTGSWAELYNNTIFSIARFLIIRCIFGENS